MRATAQRTGNEPRPLDGQDPVSAFAPALSELISGNRRIASATQWANYQSMFGGLVNPPTPIIIPTKSVIGFGVGATLAGIDPTPGTGGISLACSTIYSDLMAEGAIPSGAYIDCANELDQTSNWTDTETNAGKAISRIACYFKGLQSDLRVMAGSFSKFDATWITPMLDEMLAYMNDIDSLSWHAEGFATTPSSAAANIATADTDYRISGTWNAIGANTMKLCINEYGSQTNEQWLSPAFVLAYLAAFEASSPPLDIACRTCWSTGDTPGGCFDGVSLAYMLAANGSNIPNGVFELYRRYADSQGCRLAVSQSDSTIATLAYAPSGAGRISLILGGSGAGTGAAYDRYRDQVTDSFTVSLNSVGALFANGIEVECRTTLLDRYPIGLRPAQAIVGRATVGSGSVSFSVPAIKYGQALAVDIALPIGQPHALLRRGRLIAVG